MLLCNLRAEAKFLCTQIIDALSAAGVFKFVFRAGMPAAQPGPLVNHGSDAPTTGEGASPELQLSWRILLSLCTPPIA